MPPTPMTATRILCPVLSMVLRCNSAHGVNIRRHQLIDISWKMLPRIPLHAHHAAGDLPAFLGNKKERKTGDVSDGIASRVFPLLEFRPSLFAHLLPPSRDHRVEHLRIHLAGGNAVHCDAVVPEF